MRDKKNQWKWARWIGFKGSLGKEKFRKVWRKSIRVGKKKLKSWVTHGETGKYDTCLRK